MRDVFRCEWGSWAFVRVVVYDTVVEWWGGWRARETNYCLA